jgi:cholesterol oxidase
MIGPLADNWNSRASEYDVVVIGSGYGGAINAARIASSALNPKPSVCVLERGAEWLPGTFPDSQDEMLPHRLSEKNPLGLYQFSRHKDISIIQGSGLGGTSLVNANVAIIPEDKVFDNNRWPGAIKMSALKEFYARAANTLEIHQHIRGESLAKVQALKRKAGSDAHFELLRLAVNFERNEIDENGVERRPCNDCGNCVLGCNARAKNTVYMNYLPIAKRHGAKIFTQIKVRYISELKTGGYLIHYERFIPRQAIAETGTLIARRMVILSAGSLGSSEIMLRSREKGLPLPDTTGTRFGGNGDFFGLAYNGDTRTDIVGFGGLINDKDRFSVKAGPTIVAALRYNQSKPLQEQITIEDLSVPSAAMKAVKALLPLLPGKDTDGNPILDFKDNAQEAGRRLRDVGDFHIDGALNHTMGYLVMAHDNASGKMTLQQDKLDIDWNGVGSQEIFDKINKELLAHAKSLGARFIENPVWAYTRTHQLITAHPLGGCPMGESHHTGLVNDLGQVFDSKGSPHKGLYIADGSIIPTALGVNPFLTISALSERIAAHIVTTLSTK